MSLRHSLRHAGHAIASALTLILSGCTGTPEGAHPVPQLDIQRYLGTWYEIARFDHRFERGLQCVTANYSLRDDGLIRVINRGRNADGKWQQAEGKASPLATPPTGRLKVSFFGPFYSGYNILSLDEGYQYALVSGPNHGYLWVLSRTPTMPEDRYQMLLAMARDQGFDTDQLMRINQDAKDCTSP